MTEFADNCLPSDDLGAVHSTPAVEATTFLLSLAIDCWMCVSCMNAALRFRRRNSYNQAIGSNTRRQTSMTNMSPSREIVCRPLGYGPVGSWLRSAIGSSL